VFAHHWEGASNVRRHHDGGRPSEQRKNARQHSKVMTGILAGAR
jgi:hypothetical protein